MKLSRIYNELVNREWSGNKDLKGSKRRADDVLNHYGDDTDIRSIDYQKVMGFIEACKREGLTGSTINRRLAVLSKMFTVARRFDPKIMRPEITRQKEGKPRQRVLTTDEANALINGDWKFPLHRSLTVLLMDTGVRPSEIIRGKWKVEGDELTLFDTKNGEDRTLPLTPEAKAAALDIKAAGKRLPYTTYLQHYTKVRKAVGLGPDVTPYTMRHSAITKLAEATDNVILIQKWAGHKDIATTQRYVKATRKGLEKLAAVLRRN